MALGSTCILYQNVFLKLKPKKVSINGTQKGMLLNLEIRQTFENEACDPMDISYIFPNDLKMCIYDLTFVIGDKTIKPKLVDRNEARYMYSEAVANKKTAIYGAFVASGISEFKIGNLQSGATCEVILKMALTGCYIDKNKFYIKFPLDVYTPSGSIDCLNIKSNFNMEIKVDKKMIKDVTSNVLNYEFDKENKIFKIKNKIKNKNYQNSIIMTFESVDEIKSSVLLVPNSPNCSYDYCAVTIVPDLKDLKNNKEKEFIFLIDCSGSMRGMPILHARECLEIFIHSLPKNSYFNIIQFGSHYKKLFDESRKYDQKSAQEALSLVQKIEANLGGTNMYDPLKDIFQQKSKYGKKRLFILTDGEIENTMETINLVSRNSNDNQCFTIGLGNGCDSGLIEKIAEVSGGKSDFIQDSKLISEKVIPQLQASFHENLQNIEITTEGDENSSFELSPYPIPAFCPNNAKIVFLRGSKVNKSKNRFSDGLLVTCEYDKKTIELPINYITNSKEDKDIYEAIPPLFAYEFIKKLEQNEYISFAKLEMAKDLSISSGVLCEFTGYIGMMEQNEEAKRKEQQIEDAEGVLFEEEPPYEFYHPFPDQFAFENSDEYDENDDNMSSENDEQVSNENDDNKDDNKFDMIVLIRNQNIEGFWDNLDEVNRIIGTNIDHLNKIQLNNPTLEKKCVATVVAIAALNVLFPTKINSWKLIEEKAIFWLKETLKVAEISDILEETERLIPK